MPGDEITYDQLIAARDALLRHDYFYSMSTYGIEKTVPDVVGIKPVYFPPQVNMAAVYYSPDPARYIRQGKFWPLKWHIGGKGKAARYVEIEKRDYGLTIGILRTFSKF